ncbi:hypothetical protein IFR35_10495 [Pseudomonas fluorescens]|uniref:hypothetical protein n=1 Tax=Pseudomonas fluorescens TaxID=294 RepID=UPI00178222D8|nr:hypothetical protein [Pseudomonas fluorescens]MBD8192300.1 hypothetical protein [Pseudomonas fluorescens]MBD8226924.1 hypothetical protein [Pseudomonas fluorescens]MBD8784637.1 hypothetical protein [Pseudomonas fluorescens]MBD8817317.1 hypothetical protein [Pseudomonas fluorescens]
MNLRNVITFLALLFLPIVAFADATAARSEMIYSGQHLTLIIFFLLGLILLISGGYKLVLMGEQGQKNAKTVPVMFILAGVLLMNITTTLGVFGSTFFDVEKACYIVVEGGINGSCMDTEVSGLTGELKARIEKLSSGSTAEEFLRNVQIIIAIFQSIGLVYFGVGVYGLTQVASGSAQNGYGKPIITMFASALIFDIPHTAQMAIDTLEKIGINF